MSAWVPQAILIGLDVPLFVIYGRVFWDDLQGFLDSIYFWLKPDVWSWFDGQLAEDWWNELKLGIFVATCGAVVGAELTIIAPWLKQVLFG